jgi:hypothetical protein
MSISVLYPLFSSFSVVIIAFPVPFIGSRGQTVTTGVFYSIASVFTASFSFVLLLKAQLSHTLSFLGLQTRSRLQKSFFRKLLNNF